MCIMCLFVLCSFEYWTTACFKRGEILILSHTPMLNRNWIYIPAKTVIRKFDAKEQTMTRNLTFPSNQRQLLCSRMITQICCMFKQHFHRLIPNNTNKIWAVDLKLHQNIFDNEGTEGLHKDLKETVLLLSSLSLKLSRRTWASHWSCVPVHWM